MSTLQTQRDERLFEARLQTALSTALNGACALVVVPASYPKQIVFNALTKNVPADRTYQMRMAGTELHFEGTRGSVRVYDADHIEFDRKVKRMIGYPHGIATFLHPELDV